MISTSVSVNPDRQSQNPFFKGPGTGRLGSCYGLECKKRLLLYVYLNRSLSI